MFCIYLRTNSDLCHLQHKMIGFYNRDEKCLLRGTKGSLNKAVFHSSLKSQSQSSNTHLYIVLLLLLLLFYFILMYV